MNSRDIAPNVNPLSRDYTDAKTSELRDELLAQIAALSERVTQLNYQHTAALNNQKGRITKIEKKTPAGRR